jgi:hypothetical protein
MQLNRQGLIILKKIVMPRKRWQCHYCKNKIDPQKENFSIMNKPDRIVCGSIFCVNEAIDV